MTIKKSLILSHVSMCILPFLMTFFVLMSSFLGLYLYAKSGNHVMAESDFQFQVMSQAVRTSIFHNIRHGEDPMEDHWVLDIMDPIQSYVVLYEDGKAIMQYGNDAYQKMVEDLKQKKVQQELDEGGHQWDLQPYTDGRVLFFRAKCSLWACVSSLHAVSQACESK